MAGLTITVGGNNITDYVDVTSIRIEQVATSHIATAVFDVEDHTGTVSISAKDTVTIDDDGTTIFAGEVAAVDRNNKSLTKKWRVECQDYNILLDETVVETLSYAAAESDSGIIDDVFTTYRSDIDSTTHVATLDASMEAVAYSTMTLREILDDLAERTGARYYVDFDKNLHWFDTESNPAVFGLSTSPNGSTTFGYGGFVHREDATRLAEKVLVEGKGVRDWHPSAPAYDGSTRHAAERDQRISTAQGITDRGTAMVGRYGDARDAYELYTYKDGLTAGMSVDVTNELWGMTSETLYIRKIVTEFIGLDGEKRIHYLWLNDEPVAAGASVKSQLKAVEALETEVAVIDDKLFDTDAPAAPSALVGGNLTTGVAEDADGHQDVWLQVTWSAVADDDLAYYDVQISTSSDFSGYTISRRHANDGDRIERFAGLLGNTDYYVRVRAVDLMLNASAWDYGGGSPISKTTASDTAAPAQVAGLSAASSRTIVGLQWTANSEKDLAYYEIQRADDSGGSPGAWSTIALADLNFYVDQDFTDGEISSQDTFWYRVRAVDTSGNEGAWATQTSVSLGQITTDHIAANTITANNIAANTITATEIAANTITAAEIAASTITATELNVATLSAIAADMGTLTAGEIQVGTGTVGVNFTGFRIYSTYIGGFSSDVLQAGIRASDGKLVCGAGSVEMDADGITLAGGTGDVNSIKWDSSGTEGGRIFGYYLSNEGYLYLNATDAASPPHSARMGFHSNASSGKRYIDIYDGHVTSPSFTGIKLGASGVPNNMLDVVGDLGYSGDLKRKLAAVEYTSLVFVPIAAIASTFFNGTGRSTTSWTKLTVSTDMSGVPSGIGAILLRVAVRDSGSAANDVWTAFGEDGATNYIVVDCSGLANDAWERNMVICKCDSNGDIYYRINSSGSATQDIVVACIGYFI